MDGNTSKCAKIHEAYLKDPKCVKKHPISELYQNPQKYSKIRQNVLQQAT